jgi:hypothetical protein
VAQSKVITPLRLRDWPMFRASGGVSGRRKNDGRPLPRIADLLMSHLPGTPADKLAWLLEQKAAHRLDGDDPEEIAEAEAMLHMLARLAEPKVRKRHLDELLDEALRGTFPASDPVSVGRFTGTETGTGLR